MSKTNHQQSDKIMDKFKIELGLGTMIEFSHSPGSNLIEIENVSNQNNERDKVTLDHNQKLRLVKWLINTIQHI